MLKQGLIALAIAAMPLVGAHAQRGAPDFAAAVSAPGRPESDVALDAVRRGPCSWAGGCWARSRS